MSERAGGLPETSLLEKWRQKEHLGFKATLTPEEFASLKERFFGNAEEDARNYIYFDTSADEGEARLKELGVRLRVRELGSHYRLEFKKRGGENAEIREKIHKSQLNELISGTIPKGKVKKALEELGIDSGLVVIEQATSRARAITHRNFIVSIEETLSQEAQAPDYEIEFYSLEPIREEDVASLFADFELSPRGPRPPKIETLWRRKEDA